MTADKAAAPAETVPPQTGLVILGGLAALGLVSLLWHPLVAARRRTMLRRQLPTSEPSAPRVPTAVSGVSAEVISRPRDMKVGWIA